MPSLENEKVHLISGKEKLRSNEIPVIAILGENLPDAWESAVLSTWEFGSQMPTEYDQTIDPLSRVATMMIVVANPFAEPRIHKAIPCGLDDLAIYVSEVVDGVHDYRVGEEGWSYSYHDRLRNWPGTTGIDQIEEMVKKLAETPYSRRVQAITWNPTVDATHHEPPCLQRVWCQVIESGDNRLLEMNTHWRSRDGYKAAFMNMFALTELQKIMADEISRLSGREVGVGRYVDITDNFHLYGSYIRKGELEGFLKAMGTRSFEKRTYRSDNPIVVSEFELGRQKLEKELKELQEKK